MKNVLMNSDFQVWQNGTSFSNPSYSTTADRFVWGGEASDSARYTISRSDVVPDNRMAHSWKIACDTASSDNYGGHLRYALEGFELKRLWGQECVLRLWVESNKTGTYCVAFSNSSDRTYIAEYTIDVADTPEFKEITLPLDTLSGGTWNFEEGVGIKIRWSVKKDPDFLSATGWTNGNYICTSNQVNLFSNTDNYWRMTGVDLRLASEDYEFEPVDYPTDLLRCMRYQQVFTNLVMQRTPPCSASTSSVIRIQVPLFVPLASGNTQSTNAPFATLTGTRGTDWRLRSTAEVTETSGNFNGTSADLGRYMPSIRFEGGSYSAGEKYQLQFLTINGKLRFNAELV